MQVRTLETTLIKPSTPPLAQDQLLPLSHLDADPNLDVTFRYLRAYVNVEQRNHGRDAYRVVAGALSGALCYYYPLCGTLRRRNDDHRRLELHCAAGQGLLLIHATANCTLHAVNYLDDADSGFLERLIPDPDPEEILVNPCMLQVTVFECGGFSLGAAIHHAMCDGLGATLFFGAAAELARGADRVSIEPVWDRDVLLGPRSPGRVEAPVGDYLCEKGRGPYDDEENCEFAREFFTVREEWLDRFKAWMLEKCGQRFTTFEALSAFIWRAKLVKVADIPGDETVKLSYSTNIRKLLKPPLPVGYWGNGCVPIYVQTTAKDLLKKPIWEIAELIRRSKRDASDEYVRSYIDFQEAHRGEGFSAGKNVSGFTDWRHLGHLAVDFGWGGPANVLPLSRKLLGSNEACFFLPCAEVGDGDQSDGFRVLVNLKGKCLSGFREEMEKLGKMEFGFA